MAGPEGFAPIHGVLGQDHRGPLRGVRLAAVSVDVVWEAALFSAEAIHNRPSNGPKPATGRASVR